MSISQPEEDSEVVPGSGSAYERERRLFSILESVPVAILVLDAQGKPVFANELAKRLRGPGVSPEATREGPEVYTAFVAGTNDRYAYARMPIIRALTGETSMVEDMEIERPDGRIHLRVSGAPIRDENGLVTHAVSAFSNVTAQKRFEQALLESEDRFRAIFEESPLGIFLVDVEGRFIRVNEALSQMTGYGASELLGRPVADITYPEDLNVGLPQRERLLRGEITRIKLEKRYIRKDGGIIWLSVYSSIIRDARGAPLHALAMAEDITARREMQASVQHLAYHDALTGLPNRRLMLDRIEQAIARARRHGGDVALLSIDLDCFKRTNDEHGHAAGDALLTETARRLERCIRESDTAARMGGDEFLVLLGEASASDLNIIRDRITASLARPVFYEGLSLLAPASIGCAVLGSDACDTDSLLKFADAAMYADKESHRTTTR